MKFNNGYHNIKVKMLNWEGDNLAKRVYEFGRLSHDFIDALPVTYDKNNPECIKLIDKIIEGTTLPKFALQGHRIEFRIQDITRIALAQVTRDAAIFASASTGVFPMSQEFNIPMSIYNDPSLMEKLTSAQKILEEAYIEACEKEIPSIEARYIGLHAQLISLTAAYLPSDFVRSCHSRTSSNFCDEANYIYRLMFSELEYAINRLEDEQSKKLWQWLINEKKCVNDGFYERERLFNSDFTHPGVNTKFNRPALNDWRNSGWKMELERMAEERPYLLTHNELEEVLSWKNKTKEELATTYDGTQRDTLINAIKHMDYYTGGNK